MEKNIIFKSMKHILLIAALFLNIGIAQAAIDDNLDYNFINSAFSNPNPTTNQDFENVMKELEKPKKEGLFQKIYKFFDKDKIKYDENFKTQYQNAGNQPKRLKDIPENKPTVLISANAVDSTGNKVGAGYYQVRHKKQPDGKYTLDLYQGSDRHIATLIARPTNEDYRSDAIMYCNAQSLENGYIKVIYANLDITLVGYLKMVKEEPVQFEPVF